MRYIRIWLEGPADEMHSWHTKKKVNLHKHAQLQEPTHLLACKSDMEHMDTFLMHIRLANLTKCFETMHVPVNASKIDSSLSGVN